MRVVESSLQAVSTGGHDLSTTDDTDEKMMAPMKITKAAVRSQLSAFSKSCQLSAASKKQLRRRLF